VVNCRQCGIGTKVSYGHFGTNAELSGQFGPVLVLKCLGSKLSRVRSVYTPCSCSTVWRYVT